MSAYFRFFVVSLVALLLVPLSPAFAGDEPEGTGGVDSYNSTDSAAPPSAPESGEASQSASSVVSASSAEDYPMVGGMVIPWLSTDRYSSSDDVCPPSIGLPFGDWAPPFFAPDLGFGGGFGTLGADPCEGCTTETNRLPKYTHIDTGTVTCCPQYGDCEGCIGVRDTYRITCEPRAECARGWQPAFCQEGIAVVDNCCGCVETCCDIVDCCLPDPPCLFCPLRGECYIWYWVWLGDWVLTRYPGQLCDLACCG